MYYIAKHTTRQPLGSLETCYTDQQSSSQHEYSLDNARDPTQIYHYYKANQLQHVCSLCVYVCIIWPFGSRVNQFTAHALPGCVRGAVPIRSKLL
jgi:hypothetical protein